MIEPEHFGTEQVTEEDRAYKGSRFAEVRDALFANPYQKVWGRDGEPPLPTYEVTLRSVLRGILPRGKPYLFRQATERAVDSHADLRWGPNGKGFRPGISSRCSGCYPQGASRQATDHDLSRQTGDAP